MDFSGVKVIALMGEEGSGKDTISKWLQVEHGYIPVSFGTKVKEIVASLCGWTWDKVSGDTKESREWRETPDEWWTKKLNLGFPITPRWMFRNIGTEVMKDHFHPLIWCYTVERRMLEFMSTNIPATKFVITDLRFHDENQWIIDTLPNVTRVRVERIESECDNIGHRSQIEWLTIEPDIILTNNSTILELKQQAQQKIFDQV